MLIQVDAGIGGTILLPLRRWAQQTSGGAPAPDRSDPQQPGLCHIRVLLGGDRRQQGFWAGRSGYVKSTVVCWGPRSTCLQGTDGMVPACAVGAGSWVRHAALPGRSGKVWPSRGTARPCLLIRALGKRFALTDARPPYLGNTVRIHPARVQVTVPGWGQTTCVWVREQRGEAASGRGE